MDCIQTELNFDNRHKVCINKLIQTIKFIKKVEIKMLRIIKKKIFFHKVNQLSGIFDI